MKKIFKIFLYAVILVFLIEVFFRLFLESIYISIGDLNHFRGKIEASNSKEGIKIAVLGDSFTYGTKVADDETIPSFLSKNLKEKTKGTDIIVDNFGISGTSIIEHYYIFEKHIARSDYNFVVLNFFIDDFTPYYYNNSLLNPYIYCKDYESRSGSLLHYLNRLRVVEFTIIYIDLISTHYRAGAPLTPVSYMIQKMRDKDSFRYRCALNMLKQLGRQINETGKKAIFVLIPSLTLYDYQNPYPEEIAEYETMAMLIAKANGFEVVDSLVELREMLDQRYIIPNDIHYNADGYKIIADLIADKILDIIQR